MFAVVVGKNVFLSHFLHRQAFNNVEINIIGAELLSGAQVSNDKTKTDWFEKGILIITHFNFTCHSAWVRETNALRIRGSKISPANFLRANYCLINSNP